MSDLAVWRPNERDWVNRYVAGDSIDSIAEADGAPVEMVTQIVYGALDRAESASVTARRARRVAQLEKALKGQMRSAEAGDPKAAAAVAKIVPELCQLEGLYPATGGGPGGGSGAARPAQAEGATDPMRRARYVDLLTHPERDPDLLPALTEAGWRHDIWSP
jgi:hypothetical protein